EKDLSPRPSSAASRPSSLPPPHPRLAHLGATHAACSASSEMQRRFPIGAELVDGGVDFRVWAPARRTVDVVIGGRDFPLEREDGGYFSGSVETNETLYRFRLDGADTFPDPASRFQPEGPHGPSMVIDPRYAWQHDCVDVREPVIYEMHIGTFTPEGTFRAAIEKLPLLRDAGVTL